MQLVFLHLCFLSVMTVLTLETDYPNPTSKSVKIDGKTDGKSQADFPSKIKTYYLSDANYPTDTPNRTENPSLL